MNYEQLLEKIIAEGTPSGDRTGTGTIFLFGEQIKYDISDHFPLITSKKVHFRSVVSELLWFLSGSTNAKDLQAMGCTIWDEWATKEKCAKFGREEGDLGPVYGHLWRNFGGVAGKIGVDQLAWVINEIEHNPTSRRLIVSAWHPLLQNQVELPPCHTLFQFRVDSGFLHCHVYMRSCDAFLGLPFNLSSYGLLTYAIACLTGLCPGELTFSFGDVHLYNNHIELAAEQVKRPPVPFPTLEVDNALLSAGVKGLSRLTHESFTLRNYYPHPAIKAQVAV